MNLNNLFQKELADLLNVSDRTIRDWHKEDLPIPSHGTGRSLRYRWVEVFSWWKEREFRQLTSAISGLSGGGADDISKWEKVDARATAEMKLLKLAEARRMALPADEVERRWSGIMNKVRTQLLNIPNRLKVKWGRDAAADVQAEIHKACDLLAQGQIKRSA